MRSLGWVLNQCDWCPHKKGKFGPRHIQREDDVTTQREDSHQKERTYIDSLYWRQGKNKRLDYMSIKISSLAITLLMNDENIY
jgi:hypothetical protein